MKINKNMAKLGEKLLGEIIIDKKLGDPFVIFFNKIKIQDSSSEPTFQQLSLYRYGYRSCHLMFFYSF